MSNPRPWEWDCPYPVRLMLDGEEWRDIPGWSQYQVSNLGRVLRKGRPATKGYKYKGREITYIEPKIIIGYKRHVDLEQPELGRQRFSIAELVLTVFVEPRPADRPIARHLDDNYKNNILSNLAWGTRRDNRLDSSRNGIQSAGSEWAKKVSAKLKGRPRPKEVWDRIRSKRAASGNYRWSGK
jgi:hypothetical protein